jgi:hypothetical protein
MHLCVCLRVCVCACVCACVRSQRIGEQRRAIKAAAEKSADEARVQVATRRNTLQHAATRCTGVPSHRRCSEHACTQAHAHTHERTHARMCTRTRTRALTHQTQPSHTRTDASTLAHAYARAQAQQHSAELERRLRGAISAASLEASQVAWPHGACNDAARFIGLQRRGPLATRSCAATL